MKLIARFHFGASVMSFSAKEYYLCTLDGGTEIILEREWEMGGESWKRVSEAPKTIKGYNPEILGESDAHLYSKADL